jgi:hypothetical protein
MLAFRWSVPAPFESLAFGRPAGSQRLEPIEAHRSFEDDELKQARQGAVAPVLRLIEAAHAAGRLRSDLAFASLDLCHATWIRPIARFRRRRTAPTLALVAKLRVRLAGAPTLSCS